MKIPICTINFRLGNNSACGNHHFNIFLTCLMHLPIKAWSEWFQHCSKKHWEEKLGDSVQHCFIQSLFTSNCIESGCNSPKRHFQNDPPCI